MKKKLWSGRFKKGTHALVDEFNASIGFDARLYKHDIRGSIAHAMTLRKAGVLTAAEAKRIIAGLKAVESEIESGAFRFSSSMEDIHMAVEARLTERIGPLGGKLHTGRSRNDQVALDLRLWLRDEIFAVSRLLGSMKRAVVDKAAGNPDAIMPGYTHLQRAQPVLFAHHMLAYYEMFRRDGTRLLDCLDRLDDMPLGSGALAGSPYRLDRRYTARLLGFTRVTENSMDAVGDRDFAVEFLAAASILMMHLSRLSEEIVLWSSQEFAFVELSDDFSTGSSIMPQKKNPDVAELARGKTGRVYGSLLTLLTVMKGLPLAYNKDMQEDKEPLFDAVDTVKAVLRVFAPMMDAMEIRPEAMLNAARRGFLNATDAADYLVGKGVPFRQAHEAAGKAVALCVRKGITLDDLDDGQWLALCPAFAGVGGAIRIERSVRSRKTYGSTAPDLVRKRIKEALSELKREGL